LNIPRNYVDTQRLIKYNVYQTMKITIITTKTGITMKSSSIKSNSIKQGSPQAVHRRNQYRRSAVASCKGGITSRPSPASTGPGKFPKCEQNLFMQNEPNFQRTPLKLSAVLIETYNEIPLVNQKITNPIKPNQTQSNPIRTQYEPNFQRIQV